MRDPRRIELVTAKLKELWYQYPDMRFGQLLYLILEDESFRGKDIFFPEEDIWLKAFEKRIKENQE